MRAVLGACCGVALAVGCARKPAPLPADTVALVGGRPITRADLDRQLQRLPPTVRAQYAPLEQRAALLETLVQSELLALEAERQGHHQDPELQYRVKQQLIRQLLQYTVDPLPHEARGRALQELLTQARGRFVVEIRDPQLRTAVPGPEMAAH